jgi:hypothetical protein
MSTKATSERRKQRISRVGVQNRILKLKEDVGILAYLRRNGLENEANKFNSQKTIEDFQTLTSRHP